MGFVVFNICSSSQFSSSCLFELKTRVDLQIVIAMRSKAVLTLSIF